MKTQPTLGERIRALAGRLKEKSDTASLEAQLLAAHAAGQPRSWVLAHPEAQLTEAQQAHLDRMLVEVEQGVPLPYVLGGWDFYGLHFALKPSVLIPRPETELLVEKALEWCHKRRRSGPASLQAADIGTGSGCIAISIAVNEPHTCWSASDLSREALQVARENVKAHGLTARIDLVQADLLTVYKPYALDLICANLPYIPSATLRRLPIFGHEPTLALDGGEDGLDWIRILLRQAVSCLAPDGLLMAEIEALQGPAVKGLARQSFPNARIELHRDGAGLDRLLEIDLS